MATSGSLALQFDIATVIEEAYRRLGLEVQTLGAGHLQSAAMSLNLILRDSDLAKLTSWALTSFAAATTSNAATLVLPAGTVDVVPPLMLLNDGAATSLHRVPVWEWLELSLPDTDSGAPTHYRVDRTDSPVSLHFWPVPDAIYTVTGYRLRLLEDVIGLADTVDGPRRWIGPLTAELAMALYNKLPGELRNAAVREDLAAELARQRKALAFDNAEPGSWYY